LLLLALLRVAVTVDRVGLSRRGKLEKTRCAHGGGPSRAKWQVITPSGWKVICPLTVAETYNTWLWIERLMKLQVWSSLCTVQVISGRSHCIVYYYPRPEWIHCRHHRMCVWENCVRQLPDHDTPKFII